MRLLRTRDEVKKKKGDFDKVEVRAKDENIAEINEKRRAPKQVGNSVTAPTSPPEAVNS